MIFLKAKTSNSISKKGIILSFQRKKSINKDKGFEKNLVNKTSLQRWLTVGICCMKKEGLLNSEIPNLGIYTIKTPLIGRISIKMIFSWSQKPSY